MVQLRNYNFVKNVNSTVFVKIFTFIFLTWACLAYNDVGTFTKSIENINEHHKISNKNYFRLLSKHEQHRELRDTRFKDKLPDRNLHKNKRNVSDHISTYSKVRSKASNNFDIYMKGYKDRYMKKKGLYKLDCYYEHKLFGKFNHMCDIAEKMRNDKKRVKSFFFKKYGIGLIIFALLPSLGLIFHILYGVGKNPGIYGLCNQSNHFKNNTNEHTETAGDQCPKKRLYDQKDKIETYGYISYIYMSTISIIVLLIVSYIFIKFIKYEKLKAGKCKMNTK
ncbi:Plasmodium exported protein, unknown function [Plasmodium vivax]|uniref:Fam-m protein n=1 Tax=Plasmodium vivax TaxID=5855 RepID=A0A565A417_PLAVI|nr:Plasmodium exported protein, unknown function [Plasmodium vivax]